MSKKILSTIIIKNQQSHLSDNGTLTCFLVAPPSPLTRPAAPSTLWGPATWNLSQTTPSWMTITPSTLKLIYKTWVFLVFRQFCPQSPFQISEYFFLLPKQRTYFHVCLKDGPVMIFPTSYAVTENQTHVTLAAPILRDLNSGCFTDRATATCSNQWTLNTITLQSLTPF